MMPSSENMLDDIEPISISYPRHVPLDSEPPPGMAAATAALSNRATPANSKSTVTFSASTAHSASASTAAADSAFAAAPSMSYSPPKLPRSSLAALAATGPGGTTISNSGGGGSSSGPLRVPLLEEEIRLLHRALAESGKQKDSYKSHLLDLEKVVLDLREEKRCAEEQLRAKSEAMDDWNNRDRHVQAAAADKERAWVARMEAKDTELTRAQKKSFDLEDALYAERSALAELRASAAQALQTEQRFKAECEAQLKKQVRALCIERNSAVQRASELEADLAQARQLSARVAAEKAQLFDQLYSASRLGPDHQPARECRAPEAALLELQRGEMENLRARLESESEESASRTHALRVELRAALQSQHDLRDKVAELKAALKKCMAAMDEQRDEAENERRSLLGKVDELQRQLQKQRDEAPMSNREAISHQTAQQSQVQTHLHQQSPAQPQPQSAQPQPAHLNLAASSSLNSPKPAAPAPLPGATTSAQPFSTLSSQEVLAQSQMLLEQEQAAAELRRLRREERRLALNADDSERKYAESSVAAAVAPVAPVPSVSAGQPQQSFSLDLTRVNGWSGAGAAHASGQPATLAASPPARAPLVISATQPPPLAPAAAAPPAAVASSAPAPTSALMPPVTFDWSFMDERGPSMRPFAQVRLQPEGEEPAPRLAAQTHLSFEEAKEVEMHRALEHALREVERDRLKRHGIHEEQGAAGPSVDRYNHAPRPYSPPRDRPISAASVRAHRADHASDEHTLEYALAQLARLKRRSEAHGEDTDAERDDSQPPSGPTSQVSSARSGTGKSVASSKSSASSLRRASGSSRAAVPSRPVAKPVVSTAVRSVSIKKSTSTSSVGGGGARTRDSGSNKESADHPRGPVYKPAAAVLAAAASAMDDDEHEPTSSHADAAGSGAGGRMAPLRKHAVPAGSTRVPRLSLPAPLSPAQQHKARSSSRSRGSGRSDSAERGGMLGRVTASLRKNAASIKKHQFK